jgi:hypothetical protein
MVGTIGMIAAATHPASRSKYELGGAARRSPQKEASRYLFVTYYL